MKKRMKVLALMTAMTLTFSSIPVNAAPQNDTSYSSVLSLKNWWGDFWDKVTGKGDNRTSKEEVPALDLELVEDETTVENGDMLRASTYATDTSKAADTKYFPVTMYNYDAKTINAATHQKEVVANPNLTKWDGIYFNGGTPGEEGFTYTKPENVEADYPTWGNLLDSGKTYYRNEECTNQVHVETVTGDKYIERKPTCDKLLNENSNSWIQTNYYYKVNDNYYRLYAQRSAKWPYTYKWGYSVTDSQGDVTHITDETGVALPGMKYPNIPVYKLTTDTIGYRLLDSQNTEFDRTDSTNISDQVTTMLYHKVAGTINVGPLHYAAWNFWTGNIGINGEGTSGAGGNGNRVYSGLVQDKLDANKNIQFNKTEPGIFDSNEKIKNIYTNVQMPFQYNNGTYTFDSSQMNARFKGAPTSNTSLTFYPAPQTNDQDYGDGSTTVWMPFTDKQNINGEGGCDYHFGMNATIPFTMTSDGKMKTGDPSSEDITFSFSGDDDVWIFIDGQLVLDLGGIHNRVDATLNFAENTWKLFKSDLNTYNREVSDVNGSPVSGKIFNDDTGNGKINQDRVTFAAKDSHDLTVFYLERGAGSSNCKIQFNLPMKDTVSVQKQVSETDSAGLKLSDDTLTSINARDYEFTLYKDGKPVQNTNYNLLNADGQYVQTGSTDKNGHFKIKNKQTAKFVGEIGTDTSYYIVENTLGDTWKEPAYTWSHEMTNGASETEEANGYTSMKIQASGSNEAQDSLSFVCKNTMEHVDNTTLTPQDDEIVIDYGLPVEIDVLKNDVALNASKKTLESVVTEGEGAPKYGNATVKNGKITYQLTKPLDGVEVLTYTVKATADNGVETDNKTATAKVYIIPATTMYYEDNFSNFVTFEEKSGYATWSDEGTPQTDLQEPGVVGTVGDSPYGSDKAYIKDGQDSNGTSKHVNTQNAAAQFKYTFTGEGTTFFARTTNNSAYMKVVITDQGGNIVYTGMRDTSYKTDNNTTTLYNIPVFSWYAENYGTYTVTVSLAKKGNTKFGSDFWLDGIRVYKPININDVNYGLVDAAYGTDGEANCTVATLREKLIAEAMYEDKNGKLIWSEVDQENGNFVLFTDTNGAIIEASEYVSNGPKEEVYLNEGQKISFALKNWDTNANKLYFGIKAPMGAGAVEINSNRLEIKNATDCYYDISEYITIKKEEDGGTIGTVEVKAVNGLISVTNLKATGNVEFTLVGGDNIDVPEGETVTE